MKLVHFQVEHLWHLEVDLGHNVDGRWLLAEQDEWVIEILTGQAWSLEHGDRIVACGGRSGVADSGIPFSWWILFEKEALSHRLSLTRIVRQVLRDHAKEGDIAHALDPAASHWLEVLGFHLVGSEAATMRYVWRT